MVFAVHISDGVIAGPWLVVGWVLAAGVVAVASWRVRDADVSRIGVLTAAFFVGSLIHLKLGAVSAHLLLNGLLGVVLGVRAGLAIAVGLLLQALLFGHGGVTTLGVNVAVYAPPAMLCGLVCGPLRRSGLVRVPAVRFALVFVAAVVLLGTAVLVAQWLQVALTSGREHFPADPAAWWVCHPIVVVAVVLGAAAAAVAERWIEADPEFAVGLLLGGATAYATVGLNVLWLAVAGLPAVRPMAGVALFINLPVVLVEAVGVGFVLAFLAKARPEWVGGPVGHSGTGNTSSNGTSH
ncbi:MAG TPA: energy-coupling factor ABC transporter permease [Fimbriiglobus sp.]|nr:energy-coupling factor ABC transporter permease [Fimbriiglobus sp.]